MTHSPPPHPTHPLPARKPLEDVVTRLRSKSRRRKHGIQETWNSTLKRGKGVSGKIVRGFQESGVKSLLPAFNPERKGTDIMRSQ